MTQNGTLWPLPCQEAARIQYKLSDFEQTLRYHGTIISGTIISHWLFLFIADNIFHFKLR